jgi:hypothetical protein
VDLPSFQLGFLPSPSFELSRLLATRCHIPVHDHAWGAELFLNVAASARVKYPTLDDLPTICRSSFYNAPQLGLFCARQYGELMFDGLR